ncbi:hypothetical protein RQP46_005779 [Phenoliferia psychrophenolica]
MNGNTNGTNGTNGSTNGGTKHLDDLDHVLVGAGFGGTLMLWRLRELGFRAHLIESTDRTGGVWSSNHYPGARVDSDVPTFEFSDPKLWKDWKWTERHPGQPEILTYFDYVREKLKLDDDISYNTTINSATWDETTKHWTLGSEEGSTFRARNVVWCIGYFTKRVYPNIPGLEKFKGPVLHPGAWPLDAVDVEGKRVGIIGTGASAVQIIQQVAPKVKSLTVFQRTPNTALPMVQRKLPPSGHDKSTYEAAFSRLLQTNSGFLYSSVDKSALDDTAEERDRFFDSLFAEGGFSFYLGNYRDLLTNLESNHLAYDYWRRSVWKRINDPALAAKLAPLEPMHSFGAKRPCLEQGYYEVFNQDNVKLVDLLEDPITRVTEDGVETASGLKELDILITATGYDAVIGSYRDLHVTGKDGKSLFHDRWAQGSVYTYLGLITSGFPNSFYIFGPQARLCSVSSYAGALLDLFKIMREKGYDSVESTPEADQEYNDRVVAAGDATVLGIGAGWFFGTNIPGKNKEPQIYLAGIPAYKGLTDEEAAKGYPNMVFTKAEDTKA